MHKSLAEDMLGGTNRFAQMLMVRHAHQIITQWNLALAILHLCRMAGCTLAA